MKPATVSTTEGEILVPDLPSIGGRARGILIDGIAILLASFKEPIVVKWEVYRKAVPSISKERWKVKSVDIRASLIAS